jgi:hypothetical protein
MSISEKKLNKEVILVSINSEKYNDILFKLVKQIKNKKVCFLTTNKGYNALIEIFKNKKINEKNFYFIDCVTKAVTSTKKEKNCTFLSSPQAIDELALECSKAIANGFDIVLVDSLSTLMIYHPDKNLTHLVHNLINQTKEKNKTRLILTISNKDEKSYLFEKVSLMSDEVIKLKN